MSGIYENFTVQSPLIVFDLVHLAELNRNSPEGESQCSKLFQATAIQTRYTHTIIIYEKKLIWKLSLLAICMLIDIATLIISARGSILTNEKRSQTSWLFVLRCLMFLPLFIFSVFIFAWSIDKGKDFILRKRHTVWG